ncbi:MAG TPA: ribonuclease P protein component [Acidobacteriota bacterium]|nr:ribonuclease P protein component [Acidobacteriota bacterium]
MNESLSSKERVKKKKEFLLTYKKGNRYRGTYFTVIFLANDRPYSRLAAVAGKRVGNAVKRNKVKRWIKTLFRRNKDLLKDSKDLIFIAKENIAKASWKSLQKDFIRAIEYINQK